MSRSPNCFHSRPTWSPAMTHFFHLKVEVLPLTRVHTMSSFQHFTTADHRRGGHTNAGNNNNKNSFRLPSTVTGALASPSNKTKLLFYSEARPDREGRGRERAIAGRRSPVAPADRRVERVASGARARVTHPAERASGQNFAPL